LTIIQTALRLSFPAQSRARPLRASRRPAARRPRTTRSNSYGGRNTRTRALALAGWVKYDPGLQNRPGSRSRHPASNRTPSFLTSRAMRRGLFSSHALTYSLTHPLSRIGMTFSPLCGQDTGCENSPFQYLPAHAPVPFRPGQAADGYNPVICISYGGSPLQQFIPERNNFLIHHHHHTSIRLPAMAHPAPGGFVPRSRGARPSSAPAGIPGSSRYFFPPARCPGQYGPAHRLHVLPPGQCQKFRRSQKGRPAVNG